MDFEVATFDCYGTLVDWEGGAGRLPLRPGAAPRRPRPAPAARAARALGGRSSSSVIGGDYRPYKEVLAESLERWAEERGYA